MIFARSTARLVAAWSRSYSTRTRSRHGHCEGAVLVTNSETAISAALDLYSKMIPCWSKGLPNSIRIEAWDDIDGSGPNSEWVPSFCVENDSIDQTKQSVLDHHGTVVRETSDGRYLCLDHQSAPFLLSPKESLSPLSSPHPPGHVNWLDYLTRDAQEKPAAAFYTAVLGWDTNISIPFPAGEYIVAFGRDHMGRNSDKVTGIVPKGALVPSLEEPSFLCFFDVPTKSELEKATQVAEDNGCETFLKNFHIEDGDVTIAADPNGAIFGLYHRTDEWDGVKNYNKGE